MWGSPAPLSLRSLRRGEEKRGSSLSWFLLLGRNQDFQEKCVPAWPCLAQTPESPFPGPPDHRTPGAEAEEPGHVQPGMAEPALGVSAGPVWA